MRFHIVSVLEHGLGMWFLLFDFAVCLTDLGVRAKLAGSMSLSSSPHGPCCYVSTRHGVLSWRDANRGP